MIVYHGSTEIIKNPDVVHSKKYLDFGRGFYITTFENQAKKWAVRKGMRQEKNAIVNVYELSEAWDDFKVLSFEKENEKWLDFVCACRKGQPLNNDDVNIHHAQLIFNTHNPIFLNSNLFRRDEIKFVERDDDTHDSILYALSDFGTTSDKGVRKHEDYMSKYFVSQYGAIKDIDFTPIFEEILCDEKEG